MKEKKDLPVFYSVPELTMLELQQIADELSSPMVKYDPDPATMTTYLINDLTKRGRRIKEILKIYREY